MNQRSINNRWRIAAMAAVVLALTIIGWGGLWLAVDMAPAGAASLSLAIGGTVFALGARHAFDADHIAAIDNTTRSLINQRRPAASVGMWFSLGHLTVVVAVCALLTAGVRTLIGVLREESAARDVLGTIGTAVSATFLLIIGVINGILLIGLIKTAAANRAGRLPAEQLDQALANRGILARLLKGQLGAIRRPWQIYPVGVLFGLGFDTATEVGLFVIASGAAAMELPWWAPMTLPIIFAAGMTLFDSIDGIVMSYTYGWAAADNGGFRLRFNLIVTSISVALALSIGLLEVCALLADAGVRLPPIPTLAAVDLSALGYVAVVAFLGIWGVGLIVARRSRPTELVKPLSN
jgi:high-affinity nickel-transport protein